MEVRVALVVASLLCVCLADHHHDEVDYGSGDSTSILLMPDLATESLEATISESSEISPTTSSSPASLTRSTISPSSLSPFVPSSLASSGGLLNATSPSPTSTGSPISPTIYQTLTSSLFTPTPLPSSQESSSLAGQTSSLAFISTSVSSSLFLSSTALPSPVSQTTLSMLVSPSISTLLISSTPQVPTETSSVQFLSSSSQSILPASTQSLPATSQSISQISSEASSVISPVQSTTTRSISSSSTTRSIPAVNSRPSSLFSTPSQSFSSSSQFTPLRSQSLSLRPPIPTPSGLPEVIMVQIELRLNRAVEYTDAATTINGLTEQFSTKLNVSRDSITSVTLLLNGEVQFVQRFTKRQSQKQFDSVRFEVTTERAETANALKDAVSQQTDGLSISVGNMTLSFTVSLVTPTATITTPADSTLPSSSSTLSTSQMPTGSPPGNSTGLIAVVIICVLLVVLILVVMVIVLALYIYKKTHTRSYKFDVPLDDIATTPVWKSDIPPCDDESTVDIDAKCAEVTSDEDKKSNED